MTGRSREMGPSRTLIQHLLAENCRLPLKVGRYPSERLAAFQVAHSRLCHAVPFQVGSSQSRMRTRYDRFS